MPLPFNVTLGSAVTFCVLLMLLLRNLIRRRPTELVAACCVVLGMFLAYQLALPFPSYKLARQARQARGGNAQAKVWAEMRTGLY